MKKINVTTEEIQELLDAGLSQRDVAAELGISQTTVYQRLSPEWRKKQRLAANTKNISGEPGYGTGQVQKTKPGSICKKCGKYEIPIDNHSFCKKCDIENKRIGGCPFGFGNMAEV